MIRRRRTANRRKEENVSPSVIVPSKSNSARFIGRDGSDLQILKRSSNAFRAVVGPCVPVWRSIVVRGEKRVHSLRASFGATRAGSACCVHSKRALVSKDTH